MEAVVERVHAVGARAHVINGEELTVIGAIGDAEHVARLALEGTPGVDHMLPDLQALQAGLQPDHPRRAQRAGHRRAQGGRRPLRDDRRPVHDRVARADARHRADRGGRRGHDVPRRRLQAAHLALRLPGPGPGGPAAAGRGQGPDGPAGRHRGDGCPRSGRGARGGRRDPDRRAQHAELHPAVGDRPLRAPGAHQARAVEHAGGAADGRRVRAQGGQRGGHAVRARASARSRPPTASPST